MVKRFLMPAPARRSDERRGHAQSRRFPGLRRQVRASTLAPVMLPAAAAMALLSGCGAYGIASPPPPVVSCDSDRQLVCVDRQASRLPENDRSRCYCDGPPWHPAATIER